MRSCRIHSLFPLSLSFSPFPLFEVSGFASLLFFLLPFSLFLLVVLKMVDEFNDSKSCVSCRGESDAARREAESLLDSFLSATVSCHCGQLPQGEFVDVFLPSWQSSVSDVLEALEGQQRQQRCSSLTRAESGSEQIARRLRAAVCQAGAEAANYNQKWQRRAKRITFANTPIRHYRQLSTPRSPERSGAVEDVGGHPSPVDEETTACRGSGVVYHPNSLGGTTLPRGSSSRSSNSGVMYRCLLLALLALVYYYFFFLT